MISEIRDCEVTTEDVVIAANTLFDDVISAVAEFWEHSSRRFHLRKSYV